MAATELTLVVKPVRRWASYAAWVAVGLPTACLLFLLISYAAGYRALIVRSGSMAPAMGVGDVIVTRVVSPSTIAVGDVVTFRDPSRDQELVTHRVTDMVETVDTFSFVTRGDANTGVERWSMTGDGSLGRLVFSIPRLGYVFAWLLLPRVHAVLLIAAALMLGITALRRIWASSPVMAEAGPSDTEEAMVEPSPVLDPVVRIGPPVRSARRLPASLVDQILSYALEHPAAGPRTIAAALSSPSYGAWSVNHSSVYGVLRRNGLSRRSDRLAAVG